jgi:hypothetical protein
MSADRPMTVRNVLRNSSTCAARNLCSESLSDNGNNGKGHVGLGAGPSSASANSCVHDRQVNHHKANETSHECEGYVHRICTGPSCYTTFRLCKFAPTRQQERIRPLDHVRSPL